MLVGALLAIAINGGRSPAASEPSTSSTASASSSPSISTEPSASASPTPSPSPTAAPIVNRAIAQLLTDTAVLRANPNATAAVLAELRAGQRLFIIGEPEETDGLRWYRVGTLDATGCDETCGQIGWVSTPVAEDDPAIEEIDVACPSSPMSAEELAAVPPLEALHCYGRSELAITGVVAYRDGDDEGPIRFSPAWLADPRTPAVLQGGIGFHPVPDESLEVPEEGARLRVRGHFEDPAATTCRTSASPDAEGDVVLPQPARVVLDCRATFVWTDYEVLEGG